MTDFSAKAIRSSRHAKAKRMGGTGDPHAKVDSSSWTPPEPLNTEAKTGLRPVSKRAYRRGGKVGMHAEGHAVQAHAGKKPRAGGGHVAAKINRNVKEANAEFGKPHVGALACGGRSPRADGGPPPVGRRAVLKVLPGIVSRGASEAAKGAKEAAGNFAKGQIDYGINAAGWGAIGRAVKPKEAKAHGGRTKRAYGGDAGVPSYEEDITPPRGMMEPAMRPTRPAPSHREMLPLPPARPMRTPPAPAQREMLPTPPMRPTYEEDTTPPRGMMGAPRKHGGRAHRDMGGQMPPVKSPVPASRMSFAAKSAMPLPNSGMKRGGAAHPDAAEDKRLIHQVVKPSALKPGKSGGGARYRGLMERVEDPNLPKPTPDISPQAVRAAAMARDAMEEVPPAPARAAAAPRPMPRRYAGDDIADDLNRAELTHVRGNETPYKRGGAAKGGNWIAGAIKHPGALHKALHVPQGQKIPEKKLAKAAHSERPGLARKARLAETLKGFHKADGGSTYGAPPRMRLVKTHIDGERTAKVYKNPEYGEHVVKYFKEGKHLTNADSFHGDAQDAHDTAQFQLKRGFSHGGGLYAADKTRPTGGRMARATGGKAGKGKTNIVIAINPQGGGQQPMPGMPPMPPRPAMPVPVPPPPPGGAGAAPPPQPMPMPVPMPMPMGGAGGPPPGGMPPMGRKHGGRAYPIDSGAGGGEARLEKIEAYGLAPPRRK